MKNVVPELGDLDSIGSCLVNPVDGNIVPDLTSRIVSGTKVTRQLGVICFALPNGIGLLKISYVVDSIPQHDFEALKATKRGVGEEENEQKVAFWNPDICKVKDKSHGYCVLLEVFKELVQFVGDVSALEVKKVVLRHEIDVGSIVDMSQRTCV